MKKRFNDVAIIGMSCILPGAPDLKTYWENILNKVDSITEAPEGWGSELYYDPDSTENDRIYTNRGGFIREFAEFNPLEFGTIPRSIDGSDPFHFLALKVAQEAFVDSGYHKRSFNREKTGVILGSYTAVNLAELNIIQHGMVIDQTLRIVRQLFPAVNEKKLGVIKKKLKENLPPFNSETAPGAIPNVVGARIANRLDLQGPNYILNAACSSSIIALDQGIMELQSGRCDMVLVGGVQGDIQAQLLMLFCQLSALSRSGRIRPFDKNADGTLLSEGVGMIIIKRLEDARRDNDRIYAVIKGLGVSSDGKAKGLLVPRLEGEILAMERAYGESGLSPATIGLMEAHGTGTIVGDPVEVQAINHVFAENRGQAQSCPFGSVKSMIGHTNVAAGMASVIKSAMALYHQIIPPAICDQPNPDLELKRTQFYLNVETKPWIHGYSHPRRAGINSFGFGGINTHTVLEEYPAENINRNISDIKYKWDSEVIVIQGTSRDDLIKSCKNSLQILSDNPNENLVNFAYTFNNDIKNPGNSRIAIIAESVDEYVRKLTYAVNKLAGANCETINDRSGIYYFSEQLSRKGKLAFMFPGEGSQYQGMLAELYFHFPEVRIFFDQADAVFAANNRGPLPSQLLFPPSFMSAAEKKDFDQRLFSMEYARPLIFAASQVIHTLLSRLGIKSDALVGHSSGEDTAGFISGMISTGDDLSEMDFLGELGDFFNESDKNIREASLMAVGAVDPSIVYDIADNSRGSLFVSMDNCPNQIVLCGDEQSIETARKQLKKHGALVNFLPIGKAYHTPLCEPNNKKGLELLKRLVIKPAMIDVYSCATAESFPGDSDAIFELLKMQWSKSVLFRQTVKNMYNHGVRTFIEVGPGSILTSFVEDILADQSFCAIPADIKNRSSITQLNHLLGMLAAHGYSLKFDYLYRNRHPVRIAADGRHIGESEQKKKGTIKLNLNQRLLTLDESMNGFLACPSLSDQQVDDQNVIVDGTAPQSSTPSGAKVINKSPDYRQQLIDQHLTTMEKFLESQQKVIQAVILKSKNNEN